MSIAPTKHFRLSPSGAKRWMECPGSAVELPSQPPTQATIDGHDSHAMASFKLDIGLPIFGDSWKADYVRKYTAFVDSLPGDKHFEVQIASDVVPEFGGTVDTLAVTDTTIHVADLKTGKWKVPAKGNMQLACYLSLAREQFPGRSQFFATIIQPAVYQKPNTAEFTVKELDTHIAKVALASTQTDVYRAGEHCRFCPLLKGCSVGQEWADDQKWRAGLD